MSSAWIIRLAMQVVIAFSLVLVPVAAASPTLTPPAVYVLSENCDKDSCECMKSKNACDQTQACFSVSMAAMIPDKKTAALALGMVNVTFHRMAEVLTPNLTSPLRRPPRT
jgi:hypothetical protein